MLTLRWGGPDDADDVVEVWNESNTARRAGVPVADHVPARVRSRLEGPDRFLAIVDEDGRPVGFAIGMRAKAKMGEGEPIPGLCHIGLVFVRPSHWGRGIGKRVVDAVLEEASSRGYDRAQLWTHADNARAQRLYEGRGFVPSGDETVSDEGDEIVRFVRCLSPAELVLRHADATHDAEIFREIWSNANQASHGSSTPHDEALEIRSELGEPSSYLVVAELGGVAVGIGRGSDAETSHDDHTPLPGLGHIGLIAVRPDAWGNGIGRALTRHLVDRAELKGYQRLRLRVRVDNARARKLYESEGFLLTSQAKGVAEYQRPLH